MLNYNYKVIVINKMTEKSFDYYFNKKIEWILYIDNLDSVCYWILQKIKILKNSIKILKTY